MEIEEKWEAFLSTMQRRMEKVSEVLAKEMYEGLKMQPPSTTQELEWATAFITFQHYGFEFMATLEKQHRDVELATVALIMDTLCKLFMGRDQEPLAKEFTKEVRFNTPLWEPE